MLAAGPHHRAGAMMYRWLLASGTHKPPPMFAASADALHSAAMSVPPRRRMRRFDPQALYRAMDRQRVERGQSWREVAEAIGVSASTITRMREGGRLEVDGMLAMVGWLGVPVETFVRE